MDLEISGRKAVIFSEPGPLATACHMALTAEGVHVASITDLPIDGLLSAKEVEAADPDIIVLIGKPAFLDLNEDAAGQEEVLVENWERVVAMAAAYRAALPAMKKRGWGRFITVEPVEAKAITETHADIERIVGLGALGLSKAIAGELGETGVTSNCILWDSRVPEAGARQGIAGTVAFLASNAAAYLTGWAIAIDDARGGGTY